MIATTSFVMGSLSTHRRNAMLSPGLLSSDSMKGYALSLHLRGYNSWFHCFFFHSMRQQVCLSHSDSGVLDLTSSSTVHVSGRLGRICTWALRGSSIGNPDAIRWHANWLEMFSFRWNMCGIYVEFVGTRGLSCELLPIILEIQNFQTQFAAGVMTLFWIWLPFVLSWNCFWTANLFLYALWSHFPTNTGIN